MKTYRSQNGPFQERPYFEAAEIETICQEELAKVKLLPSEPAPIRVERFIEKRFGATPVYEELPPGVLGYTRFTPKGVEVIVVSRSLSDAQDTVSERRVNTTLAHEAGHGLLHAHLFAAGLQPQLFFGADFDPKIPRILCRDENVNQAGKGYDRRWWEFQANQVIGALLLPKMLVEKALGATVLHPVGLMGMQRIRQGDRDKAVRILSETFNVNPAVARIRLEQVFPERDSAQLSL